MTIQTQKFVVPAITEDNTVKYVDGDTVYLLLEKTNKFYSGELPSKWVTS